MYDYPVLDPKRLVYIGLRDVEHSERAAIRALGIKTFTMHHIDGLGIGEVMRRSINHLTEGDGNDGERRPIHLSLDIGEYQWWCSLSLPSNQSQTMTDLRDVFPQRCLV